MAGPRNLVLAGLPEGEMARLRPVLVVLHAGQVVAEADEPLDAVYLPESCVLDVVKEMADGSNVGTALIGYEGCMCPEGGPDVRGRQRIVCEVSGSAWRIRLEAYEAGLAGRGRFARQVQRAERLLVAQALQIAACNAVHSLDRRLAGRLLLLAQKAGRLEFEMTHELLSTLLGVQRPTITIALRGYQAAGLIGHRRGMVSIVDWGGLEAASCECYREIVRLTERATWSEAS